MLYLFINQFTILKLKPEEEDEECNFLIIISVCNKTEVDHFILSPKERLETPVGKYGSATPL